MWKEMLIVGAIVVALAGLLSFDNHASAPHTPRPHVNPVAPLATYADGDRVDGVAYCVNGEVWLTGSDGIFQPLLKGMSEPVTCKEFRP